MDAPGTAALAPAASAQSPEPAPSTSTAPAPRNAAETGGKADSGKNDANGQLTFRDLAPGVYRLKEISNGSKLHDTVDDQDAFLPPPGHRSTADDHRPVQGRLGPAGGQG